MKIQNFNKKVHFRNEFDWYLFPTVVIKNYFDLQSYMTKQLEYQRVFHGNANITLFLNFFTQLPMCRYIISNPNTSF